MGRTASSVSKISSTKAWDAKPEKTARETIFQNVSQISIRARKKQMLGEDTGELMDDRPWVPEDSIEKVWRCGRGGQSFRHIKE